MDPFLWLDNSLIKSLIGDYPDSFDAAEKLKTLAANNERGWLRQLIGTTRIEQLKTALTNSRLLVNPIPLNQTDQAYIDILLPFLVFASWSDYVTTGAFQITRTGLMQKTTSEAVHIDKEDRDRIVRLYHGQAKQMALNLSNLHQKQTALGACKTKPGVGSGKPIATVIRSGQESRFRNI